MSDCRLGTSLSLSLDTRLLALSKSPQQQQQLISLGDHHFDAAAQALAPTTVVITASLQCAN